MRNVIRDRQPQRRVIVPDCAEKRLASRPGDDCCLTPRQSGRPYGAAAASYV